MSERAEGTVAGGWGVSLTLWLGCGCSGELWMVLGRQVKPYECTTVGCALDPVPSVLCCLLRHHTGGCRETFLRKKSG